MLPIDYGYGPVQQLDTSPRVLFGPQAAAGPSSWPDAFNQGLVRFLAEDGDHDRRTDDVIQRINETGVAWFGGTTWRGKRAMRVSVLSWRTGDEDVDRTVEVET